MIRLVHLLRRKAGTGADAFDRHWREVVGPLFAAQQARLDIERHVQTCRAASSAAFEAAAARDRGAMQPGADGICETWWPSEDALAAVLASAEGRAGLEGLAAALAECCDPAASPLWLAHEYPQVASGSARAVAGALTGVVKVHFALRAQQQLGDHGARQYWLTRHGPLVRRHAVARGTLAYNQVHRADSPLTAQLAALFGSPVGNFFGHAEAWFDAARPPQGPEAEAAKAAAVADERQFIDWPQSTFFAGKERVFVARDW